MKKILSLFAIVGLIVFSSCEGPEGPPGEDGTNVLGAVYENIAPNYYNFTSPNYSVRFTFPTRIYDSDVVLVYRFGGVDSSNRPVWQALPETYFFDDGTRDFSLKYVFTYNYVDIYLDGNDRATVPADYRVNQIFRIVVVPADFASKVNKNSYLDVITKLNIKESEVQKINF
ncbi:hypothetical protein [Flavobacterium reichenbachii]|uniref:Dihydrolipoamide dehydrogenase n=1 Tax=Flavobacterium reichenbachii TaxID=362418 RepID=A0A085ZNP6_9FLAO|nr:hypothetical protein [Flavobacterium reichenbachii]KFF06060.1 hypothetical protein IW19_11220 [Flavobacterium reichenbachii]OXB14716.1 hypothetical protein B0A68_11725 [Flavobacterium reichenbachii]